MSNSTELPAIADVTVIIPAYNAADTIERALSSIAAQTVKPKEAILIDDGSTDGTPDIAAAWRDRLTGIDLKILRQSNKGAGAARNLGLREATGNYVAFLDADDEWLPKKIECSMQAMQAENFALIAHNGWVIDNGSRIHNDIASRFNFWKDAVFDGLYRRGFISTSSVVARRDVVLSCDGFDEALRAGQDFDLWLKLCHYTAGNIKIFDWELTQYYVRSNSITRNAELRLRCCLDIAVKHMPALRQSARRPFHSFWFRISAVFYEAIRLHMKRGAYAKALAACLKYPFSLIGRTIVVLGGASMRPSRRVEIFLLLGWILITTIGYLWQFRYLNDVILRFVWPG